MNPVRIRGQQSQEQFDITTAFEVAAFQAGTVVGAVRSVEKAGAVMDVSGLMVPIPGDLFEGIASGTYTVGIRPVNAGGPGTWSFSGEVGIVGEPTVISGVVLE